MTFSDPYARFYGQAVTIDVLDVLCAQLTCDLFAIAKFLLDFFTVVRFAFRKIYYSLVILRNCSLNSLNYCFY